MWLFYKIFYHGILGQSLYLDIFMVLSSPLQCPNIDTSRMYDTFVVKMTQTKLWYSFCVAICGEAWCMAQNFSRWHDSRGRQCVVFMTEVSCFLTWK